MVSVQPNATVGVVIDIPSTPQKRQQEAQQPDTPSTHPGTPSPATSALSARIALLKGAAETEAKPSLGLVWPDGCQPAIASVDSQTMPDESLWEEILVRFGASGVASAHHAQHFENIVKAGMDANAIPFPRMELRQGHSAKLAAVPDDFEEVPCQDVVPFPLFHQIGVEEKQLTTDAERETFESMLTGRAIDTNDLRKVFYMEPPVDMDMELVPWRSLETDVMAADQCTDEQLRVWKLRAERPLSAEQLEKRRAGVNRKVFEEIRPTLEHDAALLELQAARARDKADEARQSDELAAKGAPFVAWVVPNERRWPEQPSSWKQHSKWIAMWRAQPIVASQFAFKPMKRSNSESSLNSWAAVSDVSWVEIESKASECGWQDVLDEQMPALTAAQPLMQIRKQDITEIKSLCKPPCAVKVTMEVICILLQEAPKQLKDGGLDYWDTSKRLLGDSEFMGKLLALNGYVPARALDAVMPYMSLAEFTPENVAKSSVACAGLCKWARELYKYHLLGLASAEAARRQYAQKSVTELIADSQSAMKVLDIVHIQELKALRRPPSGIPAVCSCFLYLFAGIAPEVELNKKGNVKAASWANFQKLCNNPASMLKQLQDFKEVIDAGRVPQRNIERVRRIQIDMGSAFSAEAMRKKSIAVASFCSWLISIIAYYDLAAPKRVESPVNQETPQSQPAPTLCLKDIQELKSLSKPPAGVHEVIQAVAFLLDSEENTALDWDKCKKLLANPQSFLEKLQSFDAQQVTPFGLEQAQIIAGKPQFNFDNLATKSKAVAYLAEWVLSVVTV